MSKLKLLALLFIAFFQMQCSTAQKVNQQSKNQAGHYLVDKQIDWNLSSGNYYVSIEAGEKLVFELTSTTGGDPRNDTQIKTSVLFSIPKDNNTFSLDDKSLSSQHVAFLVRHCRCMDAGYNKIESGTISGKKGDNGLWQIDLNIDASGNDSGDTYSFQFSGKVARQ